MPEKFSDIVGSEEDVARIIFSPSYIFEGRVAPTAFRWEILPSGTVEDYISVLRGATSNLDSDTRHFKARTKGDTRYGYTVLNVGKIRDIHIVSEQEVNTDVKAFPSQKFPSHAGIVTDINGKRVTAVTSITPELMILQKKLAMLCSKIVKF